MVVARGLSEFWPIAPILYSFALVAALLPAYPSFQSRNVGIISFNVWLIATVAFLLINCIVWRGNIRKPVPVYCDISVMITYLSSAGYQSSMLCITRQLYQLSKVNVTLNDKRRQLIISLLIVLVPPFLCSIGHGITQGNRYEVVEDLGCWPTVANSWVTIIFSAGFPLALSLISSVYGILTLRNFLRRRRTFSDLLAANDTSVKKGLYVRLMIIACFDLIMAVPLYSYSMYRNINYGYLGWASWEDIKVNWYLVHYYNRFIVDSWGYRFRTWFIVYMVGSFVLPVAFFLMFGLSDEPRSWYWSIYCFLRRILGIKPPTPSNSESKKERTTRSWVNSIFRNRRVTETLSAFASMGRSTNTQDTDANTVVPTNDGDPESGSRIRGTSTTLHLNLINSHDEGEKKQDSRVDGDRIAELKL